MQEADPDTDCDGDGVDEDVAMAELEPDPPVVVDRARTSSLLLPVADEPPAAAVGRAVLAPTATDRGDGAVLLVVGEGAIRCGDSGACNESSSMEEALPACAWL